MSPEALLAATVDRIAPADLESLERAQRAFDAKTKPRRSLGRIEDVGCRLAAVYRAVPAQLHAAIVVAAGDHGVAREDVSAYPQEVTVQMLANFAAGGAAINVLARQARARLVVVDAGVAVDAGLEAIRSRRSGSGTASFVDGPAMTHEQMLRSMVAGIELAGELADDGVNLLALGEMGIGNTTSASAISAALLDVEPAEVCGRGTGLDDAGLEHKLAVVARGLERNAVKAGDGIAALTALGGFEIAFLAGCVLGAAATRIVVVLDGFITAAAALTAVSVAPAAADSLVASHLSPEPGHAIALNALGLEPLLDLGLRLGEGSGAALAIPLLRSSIALLNEMATFDEAHVTDAGR